MDLLNDILASQAAGNASNFDGMDQYLKGAQFNTNLNKTKEDNNILASREQSNAQIAAGDLVGALRTAQSSGDQTYQTNLMNHINQNRQTLGSIAQNLTNVDPAHRQAALDAANNTLGGLDVNTSALSGADNGTLGAIANSVIDPNDQIKNKQTDRRNDISQQEANTGDFNANTSRINSGTEQYNADTNRQRLGIDATHYANADNVANFNATHQTLSPGSSIVTLENAPSVEHPTLADRNNNPGNLVYAGQPGAQPTSSGYASFQNPQDGINANLNQINRDINVHGYNTIDKLVDHWASTSPADQKRAYKIALARQLQRGVNDPLTSDDASALLPTMAKQEGYHGNLSVSSAPQGTPASAPAVPSAPSSSSMGLTTPTNKGQVGSVQSYYQPGVGNVITNVAPLAPRDTKQDDAQRRSAALWQGAQQADQVMSQAEKNGNTPDQHQIESRVGTTIRSLSDVGQQLNRYNDAAQRLSMEYANMYFGQGVSTKQMEEAANSITIKPTDSADQVNDKVVNRQNMLNYLQQATHPGQSVTPDTLAPGYVNPTSNDSNSRNSIPSSDDTLKALTAIRNGDKSYLTEYKNRYGKEALRRLIETQH